MHNFETGVGCNRVGGGCYGKGCDSPPDFCIKRGDSKPTFRVLVEDCDGAVDLTDENLVLEASMWFRTKLKHVLNASSSELSFADNVGFDQIAVGDVILTDRPRNPEKMLVLSINESAKTLGVERAYDSTTAETWAKGTSLRVFRFQDEPAEIQSFFEDIEGLDGNSSEELTDTFMVFNWNSSHTSLPGCYWLEFKLIMMEGSSIAWTKKTPLSREGFLINIADSPSAN
jgi:hypothetical protein